MAWPLTRRRLLMGGSLVAWSVAARHDGTTRASPPPLDFSAAEFQRADERARLCSGADAAGVGLQGEYFADAARRESPVLSRVDGPIDLDPSGGSVTGRSTGAVAARWTGWIKAPLSGRYRFHAEPAGSRLQVARAVVAGPEASGDPAVELAAGRFYPIAFEVDRLPPPGSPVRLEWTAPHGARYLVPRALLFLPTATAAPTTT